LAHFMLQTREHLLQVHPHHAFFRDCTVTIIINIGLNIFLSFSVWSYLCLEGGNRSSIVCLPPDPGAGGVLGALALSCRSAPAAPPAPPPADCGAGAAFDALPPCFSNAACIWLAPTRRAFSTASFLRLSLAALSAALSPLLFLCAASFLPAGLPILMQTESAEQFLHVACLRTERFGGRRHGFCASTKILHLTHLTG
jgi:hypothetical protein